MNTSKTGILSAAMAVAAMGGSLHTLEVPNRPSRELKDFTAFDQERLDKAQEKRERKAAKRLRDTQLS